jgi:hypothetical protein
MLFLTVNDRYRPGDQLDLGGQGAEVSVEVAACSDQPLTSLEVICNGQVVGQAKDLAGQKAQLKVPLKIAEGSWLAARCTDRDTLLRDEELAPHHYGGNMPRRPCRLRFAHTSPIYITVADQSARIPAAVAEAGQMLDALQRYAEQHCGGSYQEDFATAVRVARDRLTGKGH